MIRGLLPAEAALTGRPHEATVRIKPALTLAPALAEAC